MQRSRFACWTTPLTTTALGWAVAAGAHAQDCNNNGILDSEETSHIVSRDEGLEFGTQELATRSIPGIPLAGGDCELVVESRGGLQDAASYADVYVDGTFVGQLYAGTFATSSCASQTDSVFVPASVWNASRAANNGSLEVRIEYTRDVVCTGSNGNYWNKVNLNMDMGTDHDNDGLLDECEPLLDCNNNNIYDYYEWDNDTDGDGVFNGCDQCEGVDDAIDADADGIPDDCDQCPGADDTVDCNADGIADCTQLTQTWSQPIIADDCGYATGNFFYDMPVPLATSDVRVTLEDGQPLNVDAADEYYIIWVNGVDGMHLYEGVQDCNFDEDFTIPAATWNSWRSSDGLILIEILQNDASCAGSGSCGVGFEPDFLIEYEFDADADNDGWLDECAPRCNPTGPDSDGDGVGDACDDCPDTVPGYPYVDPYGCPLVAVPADLDFDGDVDESDFSGFFLCITDPNDNPVSGCEAYDYAGDNDVDMHDFLALQDAVSGTDVVAELAAMGSVVPHYVVIDYYIELGLDPSWFDADRLCEEAYGTNLATMQNVPHAEYTARFDEMSALMAAYPNEDAWFGLRYSWPDSSWVWANGELIDPNGPTNWSDGGDSPNRFDGEIFFNDQLYGFLTALSNHDWENWSERPNTHIAFHNPRVFLCDLPVLTVGNEDHIAPVALDVAIEVAGSNTVEVLPGEAVDYQIVGQLDATTTQGLAGFSFDLAVSAGVLFGPSAPAGDLQNFVYPAGYNPNGFDGKSFGTRLLQVGGGQNTMNNTEFFGPTGSVVTGVGNASTVLAIGSVQPPSTPGVYTLTLSNLVANTLNPNQSGPVWTCEPALPGSNTGLTITVVDCPDSDNDGVCDSLDICDGGNDNFDVDFDGTPNACDNELQLRFEDTAATSYAIYEEKNFSVTGTGGPFEIGNDPNAELEMQYLESQNEFTIRVSDGRPFSILAYNVSEGGLATGSSNLQIETLDAQGQTSTTSLTVFTDPRVNTVPNANINDVVEVTFRPQTLGSVLRFDNISVLPDCPGDLNDDLLVNLTDLSIVLGDFGRTGSDLAGDINGDGTVDLSDLADLLSRFGQNCL